MNGNGKLIVMGASAGGMEAFRRLVPELDPRLPAALCFVQHISSPAPTMFAEILNRTGPLPAAFARDGDPVVPGRIFLAPPDMHLVVADGKLRLVRGPRENWVRPAIDPLFRSAAAYYGSRAIGVVLSGMLDDGTEGVRAIKRCGGTTIVQDPEEAAFPQMPWNAVNSGCADHVVSLDWIPRLIGQLASAPAEKSPPPPVDLVRDVEFLEHGGVAFHYPEQEWTPGRLACPECGGPMWEKKTEGAGPFGCTVGHRFGPQSLMAAQDGAIEMSIWAALRMMQERARVLTKLAEDETRRGRLRMAKDYLEKGEEAGRHAERLKEFLLHVPMGIEPKAKEE